MEKFNPVRRKLNRALIGLAALPVIGPAASSAFANQSSPFNLLNLHHQSAKRAAELKGNNDITLNLLLPNGSSANVLPATNEFTRLTGIRFNLVETPVDDINTRMFLEASLSKGTYDIALPATFGIPDLVEAGAITDLSDYSNRYQPVNFQEDSLYTIGDYYRGKHYGYQTDGDTYLMFYNRRFFRDKTHRKAFADQHGYELKIPETWEQLDAMMAYFHQPDNGTYGGALFRTPAYMLWEWWIRFHAKGYFPLDNDLNPRIDSDAGIQALEELIAASQNLTPNATTNGLFENWEEFSRGNIFCNIGWGGTQKYLNSDKSAIRGELLFGPTPGGMVNGKLLKTSYFNWGWNYTISSNSAAKEIAYLFILFACSPQISTLAVREQGGFFDPFRREHYTDTKIIETYSKPFMEEHHRSMINSIPDLYLSGQTQYYDALREQIALASDGKLTPREALKNAAKNWRKLHFRLGRKTQKEQWQFLKTLYPESLRTELM